MVARDLASWTGPVRRTSMLARGHMSGLWQERQLAIPAPTAVPMRSRPEFVDHQSLVR